MAFPIPEAAPVTTATRRDSAALMTTILTLKSTLVRPGIYCRLYDCVNGTPASCVVNSRSFRHCSGPSGAAGETESIRRGDGAPGSEQLIRAVPRVVAAPWPVSGLLILGGAGALPGVVRGLVLGLGLTFIAIVAGLPSPAVEAAALAAGSPAEPGISANSVRYTVTVPADPTDPVEVRLQIPTPPAVVELQFPDPSGGGGRLQAIRANRDDGEALPVERVAAGGFRLPTLGARHVTVTYSLNLSPSLWNPATWPGQEL